MASHCTWSGNYAFDERNGVAINNSGMMALEYCAISNNVVSRGEGSGIYNSGNLTADYCTIAGNGVPTDSGGGGIFNAAGIVVLRNCSLTNNSAVYGGGIWNDGWLAITNCTLSQNWAFYSDGPQVGGGLYNNGYAVLQNTTLSGNIGGGIWNDGVAVLVNATIVSNRISAYECGGGIWNSGVVRSRNSIIAGNAGNGPYTVQGPDVCGNLESLGHNLIQNASGWTNVGTGTGDIVGLDPMLGPLQDNGGPTWTHALLPGSPAIDAGDSTSYYSPTEDQRGVPRPQGLGVDIGAFEYQFTAAVFVRFQKSGSSISFVACGPPFRSYSLLSSTNLLRWDDLSGGTYTAGANGVIQFNSGSQAPAYFYRLKSQTP